MPSPYVSELNTLPAFRLARLVIAELCEQNSTCAAERELRRIALRVPTHLIHRAAGRPERRNQVSDAARVLCREIERAGEEGSLEPGRYRKLRDLSSELLKVC